MSPLALSKLKKRIPLENNDTIKKKKVNRFDGLTEEEVQKYTLPDYLEMDLDIVIVGINPSLTAAHRGRYYAGPGNHFYKLLSESGLVPNSMTFDEDFKLLKYKIGLTNVVSRPTRSSSDLTRIEMKEGSEIVKQKLELYRPKIAVFNGKCIYEIFANKSGKCFNFGLQSECINDTSLWVVPSSSARCANFPRMTDKLHFYKALKKYLLVLKGEASCENMQEFLFEGKCKQAIPTTSKMWRRKNMSAFQFGGRIANKGIGNFDTSEDDIAVVNGTEFIVTKLEDPIQSDLTTEMGECSVRETKQLNFQRILQNSSKNITKANKIVSNISCTEQDDEDSVYTGITNDVDIQNPEGIIIGKELSRNSDQMDFFNLIKQRLQTKTDSDFKTPYKQKNKVIKNNPSKNKNKNNSTKDSIKDA